MDRSLASLAQLAVDTGGRFTDETNDLSLGYARAERDLACVYSLGLYVESADNTPQGITVRVRRSGMRAIHPTQYVFRSDSEKKESLIRAAWISPEMFQSGIVRAHLFPLRPTSKNSWEGLLVVAFPVPLAGAGGQSVERDFGAVLSRSLGAGGERTEHRFNRRITLQPDGADVTSKPLITFLQRVDLEPGRYTLTAVLSEPDAVEPHAAKVRIEVPEIPKRDLFLVGPILGRRAGPNLVVLGGGAAPGADQLGKPNSFEPLLLQQLDVADDLFAVTQVCLVGAKQVRSKGEHVPTIQRALAGQGGIELGRLKAEPLRLEGKGKLKCQNLVDLLPAASVQNGEYVFEAVLDEGSSEHDARGEIRFVVGTPDRE